MTYLELLNMLEELTQAQLAQTVKVEIFNDITSDIFEIDAMGVDEDNNIILMSDESLSDSSGDN